MEGGRSAKALPTYVRGNRSAHRAADASWVLYGAIPANSWSVIGGRGDAPQDLVVSRGSADEERHTFEDALSPYYRRAIAGLTFCVPELGTGKAPERQGRKCGSRWACNLLRPHAGMRNTAASKRQVREGQRRVGESFLFYWGVNDQTPPAGMVGKEKRSAIVT